MLTKDTLKFIARGMNRFLSRKRAANADPKPTIYRIRIPQDKLDLLVGTTLEDRYYVLSLLGKGGMSLVYKAKDLKSGEVVAVKCLRTQVLGDEMVVKRFQREADVLNRLNHPRIVQFFGYGTNRRGQPYFVMDYLIGTSLGEILRKQGRLDLGRFQDIFVQVAAAIGHAHKHDAVHRDIKPGNIMLVEKGGTSDYVKIVDFGIAKVTEGQQKLTRLGEVWGSPIYMSPEQCMGTTIDARTDIYSLGIVMYEALTGEVPFLGRNYADTMMKQISEEPPTFKQSNPKVDIPAALEQIVFRAIKKKPDDRYQTMGELKHDLEWALNKSLGLMPKQQSTMLSVSGKHQTTEDTVPPGTPQSIRITADLYEKPKPEKPATEMQQRVTSEDIPRFNPQERLSRTDLPREVAAKEKPKSMQRKTGETANPATPASPELDFAPPAESRLKFELTGPQVISASTDGDTRSAGAGPRVSRQKMPRSTGSDQKRKGKDLGETGEQVKAGMRPRRGRTSRNRLAASVVAKPEPDTARGAKKAPSENKLKQIVLVIVAVMAVVAFGFLNRHYFESLFKEVFFFPSEERTSVSDPAKRQENSENGKSGKTESEEGPEAPTSKEDPFDGM